MDRLQAARMLYSRGEMHDALEAAQASCELRPRDSDAWRLLGAVSRYTSMPNASDLAFRRAADLSRRHPMPFRVPIEDFDSLLKTAQTLLSPDGNRRLARTRVAIADLPEVAAIRAGQVDPDALAHHQREPEDVLILYKVNIENRSAGEADLRKYILRALTRA
jgi:hypothetical protein